MLTGAAARNLTRKVGARCDSRPKRVDLSARRPLKRRRHAIALELDGLMLRVGVARGERHSRNADLPVICRGFMRPLGRRGARRGEMERHSRQNGVLASPPSRVATPSASGRKCPAHTPASEARPVSRSAGQVGSRLVRIPM